MEEEEAAFFNFDRASRNLQKSENLFGNVQGPQNLQRHSRTLKNDDPSKLGKILLIFQLKNFFSHISAEAFENNDRRENSSSKCDLD